jgi:hypothetical protein
MLGKYIRCGHNRYIGRCSESSQGRTLDQEQCARELSVANPWSRNWLKARKRLSSLRELSEGRGTHNVELQRTWWRTSSRCWRDTRPVFLGMSMRHPRCSFALHCIGKVGKTCLKDPGTVESRPRRSRCSYDATACGKYGLRLKPFWRSLKTAMAELCLGSKPLHPLGLFLVIALSIKPIVMPRTIPFSIKNPQGILGVVVKGGLDHFNFRRRRSCTYKD